MGIVMNRKGAGVTEITKVPPTHFVADLMLGTGRERTPEDNHKILSLVTKKLLMSLKDKESGGEGTFREDH